MLEIAQAIRDRDLADLAAKQAHRKGLELARKDLIQKAEAELAQTIDPFYRKNFELPRQMWRDARIQILAQKEIYAAADVESQKKVLQKSLGRADVLARLDKGAKAARRKKMNELDG